MAMSEAREEVWFAGYHRTITLVPFDADSTTGVCTTADTAAHTITFPADNPSYLAFRDDGLAAGVSETAEGQVVVMGRSGDGAASATSSGADPCHLTFSPGGGYVLVANYSCDVVSVLRVEHGGRRLTPHAVVHAGTHAHQVVFFTTRDGGHHVLVPCLGVDAVMHYTWDEATGTLAPHAAQARFTLPAGSGPRHVALMPPSAPSRLYIFGELDCTLTAVALDPATGCSVPGVAAVTVSTLPPDVPSRAGSSGAHVVAIPHPTRGDGHDIVFASNRGHNSIAIIAGAGEPAAAITLTPLAWEGGLDKPRDFAVHTSGNWLIVANQLGDNAIVYRITPHDATGVALVRVAVIPLPPTSGPCYVGFRSR